MPSVSNFNPFQKELDYLLSTMESFNPKFNKDLVKKAFFYSINAHEGQKRYSGEPYFIHPAAISQYLAEKGFDEEVICAALLHDLLEDTSVSLSELNEQFGERISRLVEGVTKVAEIAHKSRELEISGNLQKIFLATVKDVRVLIIKLADNLHNMRTVHFIPKNKRKNYSLMSMDIYSKIAHRLGMYEIKNELESIALQYIYPNEYKKLKRTLSMKEKEKNPELNEIIKTLKKELQKMNIEATLLITVKPIYVTFRKIQNGAKSIDEIEDFLYLSVIVNSVDDCYRALGVVHNNFKPKPLKLKDFIASPLEDLYQAIHTTVIGPKGDPVKVYIKTHQMEEIRKNGIIPLILNKNVKLVDKKVNLIKKLISSNESSADFLKALKKDFLSGSIAVHGKDGKSFDIPVNGTPIDFAFLFRKKKASNLFKAKVNGKAVPLWVELKPEDKIELKFSSKPQVKSSWLNYAKSQKVISLISQSLKKNENKSEERYAVNIHCKLANKIGVLHELAKLITKQGLNINAISSYDEKPFVHCHLTITINDSRKLDNLISSFNNMDEVIEVNYNLTEILD
ncbi:MAG TPA: HD domain-containing protein [archaeon]|nr:HD domain-containing protein [archaeon]